MDSQAPKPEARAGTWTRRGVVALIALGVGAYYLWGVRAAGGRFVWGHDLGGYYNYLSRGFAGGHLYLPIQPSPALLAQPDPWDPAVDGSLKWHDLVLFNGRYYLYSGAAPAVLLFTPWRLVTGHDLPENFALFLLCFWGYLFSCGALLRVLELASTRPGPCMLAVMLVALGICQSVPYLLNRVFVYEVAIGSGYFCISGALFFLSRALGSCRRAYWLAGSGLMFGLAIASRPHLVLAGTMALAALVILLARGRGLGPAIGSREFRAFLVPWLLVGAAVAGYNYARFGNPFEFGIRYLLSGPGQNRLGLAASNLLPGLYYMLLSPPAFSPVFPWIRIVLRHPFDSAERFPLPPDYFVEPTAGALWVAPFILAVLAIPSARRLADGHNPAAPAEARTILWAAAASSAAILLFLMTTHFATQRYEVDFAPLAAFAGTANFAIHISRGTGFKRSVLSVIFVLLAGYSAIGNLALGITGPYDDVLRNRPSSYVRIARWFSPIEEFRPTINPEITVELVAKFTPQGFDIREPLVVIGQTHHQHFLYIEHANGAVRLVSQSAGLKITRELEPARLHTVQIRLVYSPQRRKITTFLNGAELIVHPVEMLVAAPAQVTIGENRTGSDIPGKRFTGRIVLVKKTVRNVAGS